MDAGFPASRPHAVGPALGAVEPRGVAPLAAEPHPCARRTGKDRLGPQLRADLDALRAEAESRRQMVVMLGALTTGPRTEIALTGAVAALQVVTVARKEARVRHEETWQKNDALGEGSPPTSARRPTARKPSSTPTSRP